MKLAQENAQKPTGTQPGGTLVGEVTVKPHGSSISPTPSPQSGEGFPPACLTRREFAGLLQVSVSTVDRLVANGEITPLHPGRAVRFSPAEVAAYLSKNLKADHDTTNPETKTGAHSVTRPSITFSRRVNN